MVVKFLVQLYNISKMVCKFFQGLIHTVACMWSIWPGGMVEGGAPKSEIWKKWFGLRGCRSIKIIYRKDYVQSFTVIQDELSEKWHFEVGRGKCVRLWRWQGHVKYTIRQEEPYSTYLTDQFCWSRHTDEISLWSGLRACIHLWRSGFAQSYTDSV